MAVKAWTRPDRVVYLFKLLEEAQGGDPVAALNMEAIYKKYTSHFYWQRETGQLIAIDWPPLSPNIFEIVGWSAHSDEIAPPRYATRITTVEK